MMISKGCQRIYPHVSSRGGEEEEGCTHLWVPSSLGGCGVGGCIVISGFSAFIFKLYHSTVSAITCHNDCDHITECLN